MNNPIIWITLLVGMNFLWACSYSVAKLGLESINPLTLVFWRFLLAFIVLAVWACVKKCPLRIDRGNFIRIVASGALLAGSNFFWVTGIEMSHATDASLLYVFEPVWGIMLANIILRERIRASTISGLVIILAGFWALLDFDLHIFTWTEQGVVLGNLLIAVSLVMDGFFSIILKPVADRLPLPLLCTSTLAITVATLSALTLIRGGISLPVDKNSLAAIAYLALICTGIGYTLWCASMKRVQVSIMFLTLFIQPIVGTLAASWLVNEPIDSRVVKGGVLLILGMIVAVGGYLYALRKASGAASDSAIPIIGSA